MTFKYTDFKGKQISKFLEFLLRLSANRKWQQVTNLLNSFYFLICTRYKNPNCSYYLNKNIKTLRPYENYFDYFNLMLFSTRTWSINETKWRKRNCHWSWQVVGIKWRPSHSSGILYIRTADRKFQINNHFCVLSIKNSLT